MKKRGKEARKRPATGVQPPKDHGSRLKLIDSAFEAVAPPQWPPVSVCIIVRDEERNLRACVESLGDLPDELVIVDTGSVDGTRELAERLGARVYQFAWIDDFAAARNESISHATREWVMWVDADDRLSAAAIAQIKRAVASRKADAYTFQIASPNRDGSLVTTEHIRLFRNTPQVRFSGPIHESIGPALGRLGLTLARTNIQITHEGYANEGGHEEKTRRNLAIIDRQLATNPNDISLVFFRGQARGTLGDGLGMAADMKAYLERTRPTPGIEMERFWAYNSLASVFTTYSRWSELRALIGRALEEFPGHPAFRIAKATHLLSENRPQEARRELVQARESLQGNVPFSRPSVAEIESLLAEVAKAEAAAGIAPGKPSISLCMIVRNEAENLEPCIESLSALASELVIVDTGSTDSTVKIAEGLGASVHHIEWTDDFAAARNESLRHATGDWILWMDADDRLDAKAVARLKEAATSGRADAYTCLVSSSNSGDASDRVEHMRLFRNHLGISFEGAVHESVFPSVARLGLRVERTDILITHTGYSDGTATRSKSERNLRILNRQLALSPDEPDLLFYRGTARSNLNDSLGAEADMRRVLELTSSGGHWEYFRSWAYVTIARTLNGRGSHEEAFEAIEPALEEFPSHPGPLTIAGTVLLELGQVERSLRCFESALAHIQEPAVGYRPTRETVAAAIQECRRLLNAGGAGAQGLALLKAGRYVEAVDFFAAAIERDPTRPDNYRYLASTLDRLGQRDDALELWKVAEGLSQQASK